MKEGDKKGTIEALKLAGVSVIENQELIPLQQTRKDVTTALSLMNEGKYYQAGLILKSAQDGIVVDSQSVQESPTHLCSTTPRINIPSLLYTLQQAALCLTAITSLFFAVGIVFKFHPRSSGMSGYLHLYLL